MVGGEEQGPGARCQVPGVRRKRLGARACGVGDRDIPNIRIMNCELNCELPSYSPATADCLLLTAGCLLN